MVRLDSAFYNAAVTCAVRSGGAQFSVTVPMNASIRTAIAAISEGTCTPIRYPRVIWDDQLDAWVPAPGSPRLSTRRSRRRNARRLPPG